ncbi:MAG: hypothetical protein HY960_09445 [Ignavibacteriae bacterium]|nr:hypothetical protein [Ignavibacteriota bacterium]
MKTKLDSLERQIENSADEFRPLSEKKQRRVETIIRHARKSRSVSIRIAESILEELKRRSAREGLPYQTLIASILHKYVTDQLVDETIIRKSLKYISTPQ